MSNDMDMGVKTEHSADSLQPVTIRFTPEAWQALRDVARQEGVSVAEIARLAITGKLGDYFGTDKCLDRAQAEEIRKQVAELGNTVSQVGMELNRIGVNYNQEVRVLNQMAKTGTTAKAGTPDRLFPRRSWKGCCGSIGRCPRR